MWRFLELGSLIIVLAAVNTAAGADDLSAQEMKGGRKLYVTKCARCHKFYNPADYSKAEWTGWMEKMSRKAKLKPQQAELLSRYLDTFRSGNTNAPTK